MANDKTDYWGRISAENDKSFEEVRDQLYFEHHYHPTNIQHFETTKSEDAQQAANDAQTESLGKQGKGKRVVNGLPGPVSSEPLTGGVGGGRVNWGCAAIMAVVVIAALVLIAIAGGV